MGAKRLGTKINLNLSQENYKRLVEASRDFNLGVSSIVSVLLCLMVKKLAKFDEIEKLENYIRSNGGEWAQDPEKLRKTADFIATTLGKREKIVVRYGKNEFSEKVRTSLSLSATGYRKLELLRLLPMFDVEQYDGTEAERTGKNGQGQGVFLSMADVINAVVVFYRGQFKETGGVSATFLGVHESSKSRYFRYYGHNQKGQLRRIREIQGRE